MPTLGGFTCSVHVPGLSSPLPELAPSQPSPSTTTSYVSVPTNPKPNDDYGLGDVPYSIKWSISPEVLQEGGIIVQLEVDGCQKGQARCYEALGEGSGDTEAQGEDDGLWAVPDGSRRRPWIWSEIKTTHPHSALSDKAILDRVGSVRVTFTRATVVPTSHVVPLIGMFNGGAPLPERMRERVSHWTKLGYIEKHRPAKEVGLAAEEIGEVLATFTFYYKSKDLLDKLIPATNGTSGRSSRDSEIKFAFPSGAGEDTPDNRSMRSLRSGQIPLASPELSDGANTPSRSGTLDKKMSAFTKARRRMSSQIVPMGSTEGSSTSLNTSTSPEKEKSKEDSEGKEKERKDLPKRARAVSMRMAKRMSILGKNPRASFDGTTTESSVPIVTDVVPSADELDTVEGLKKEVLRLRLEVSALKRHLNI